MIEKHLNEIELNKSKTRLQIIVSDELANKIDVIADAIGTSRNTACAFGLYSWVKLFDKDKTLNVNDDLDFIDYLPLFTQFVRKKVIPKTKVLISNFDENIHVDDDAFESWFLDQIKNSDYHKIFISIAMEPDETISMLSGKYVMNHIKTHREEI